MKAFSHAVSGGPRRAADVFTINAAKAARPGKYLDYLRERTRRDRRWRVLVTRAARRDGLHADRLGRAVGRCRSGALDRAQRARAAPAPDDHPWAALATTRQTILAAIRRELKLARMTDEAIAARCADTALMAGRAIRELVHAMPRRTERGERTTSVLKENQCVVDAAAEALGIEHLARLAADVGHDLLLLVDAAKGRTHRIGSTGGDACIWVSMDAVDGTVKVAGLGERRPDRVALGNDGGWAAAFAFTAPTPRPFDALTVGDFTTAVIVDGNPPRWPVYPPEVIVGDGVDDDGGSRPHVERDAPAPALVDTSTATRRTMSRRVVPRARRWRSSCSGGLPIDITGGVRRAPPVRQPERPAAPAFRLARGPGVGRVAGRRVPGRNENQANLIPAVPLVLGAGGIAVDFAGHPWPRDGWPTAGRTCCSPRTRPPAGRCSR